VTELAAHKSRRILFAGVFTCASTSLFFFCANVFPDQTWFAVCAAETLYTKTLYTFGRTQEDKIHEAVLRHLVQSHSLKGPIFLRIDGRDPSGKLIAGLSGMNPAVRRASESELAPDTCTCTERSTGECGTFLSLSSVRWSSPFRVELDGSLQLGGDPGFFGTYAVVRNSSGWAVQSSDEQHSECMLVTNRTQ
jgi:hypothetical protein